VIIEVNPDGAGKSFARGFFQITSESQMGAVGALEEEKLSSVLQVPSSDYIPFGWYHASDTTLNTAVIKCLNAWLAQTPIMVQYLYDGTNGVKGNSIITDLSLAGGLTAMNDFTVKVQGSDSQTTVGTG
jgi:hypothetical protein